MTDNKELRTIAENTISSFGSRIRSSPEAVPEMLAAAAWMFYSPKEIIIAGTPDAADTKALVSEVHAHYLPFRVLLLADGGRGQQELASLLPLIADIKAEGGRATAYICEDYACQLPTSDRAVVARLLGQPGTREP